MNDTFYKTLPNGVRIVHRMSPSEVAYVGIMVGAGTRDEDEALNGMAHYIEHCVFKGCTISGNPDKVLRARDIINKVENVGGEINAYTTKEETVFYAATPVNHYQRIMKMIANMVLYPTFPKHETDKEISVIMDEIESYEDSPSELIYDDFESLIFNGNPLALPILGTRKTLKRLSKSARPVHDWMHKNYTADRIVIFTQGRMPFKQVVRLSEELFGVLPADSAPKRCAVEPMKQGEAVYKKHTHQVHVMLGGRAYPLGHEKQLTLYLLNNILGGESMSSRLNMSLREDQGLVYSIDSQYTPLSDTGYWCINFASEPQNKARCLELINRQLQSIRENKLSATQLQRAITQLHGQMAIAAENQENNALTMAKQTLYYGHSPVWQETFQHIAHVSAEQLQDAANEIYDEKNISILTYE